eukprot:gb/GECH01012153.1/.p1 GENE.gb/GECH01012153.1/~~gb/GECH01012153.1/.p1  ORF type:complete len:241 (+),score=72.33 gb/GECH01012153.1/:1-723(+)
MSNLSELEQKYDKEQVSFMKEPCIVVDKNDNPIRPESKHICHLMKNINDGLLHRAFSVFLFNEKRELLLHKRADAKITFPGVWTNTCCSHPLHFENEMETENNIGVKRAAQRKLKQELGIDPNDVPLEDFHYLTRMHYCAQGDTQWGEHEIDHILIIQRENVKFEPNPNEIGEAKYVSKEGLKEMMQQSKDPDSGVKMSPWFDLICDNFLYKWWDNLDNLKPFEDHETIHRLNAGKNNDN